MTVVSCPIEIVGVGPEAAQLLSELHARCFASGWSSISMQHLLHLPTTAAWLASNAAPCGFVVFSRVPPEAEIITIGTLPARRNTQIAQRLLSHAFTQLRDERIELIHLEVREGNTAAVGLYLKLGFREVGRRPNYYSVGTEREDARLFRLQL